MALARQNLLRLGAPRFRLPSRRRLSSLVGDGPQPQIYISHDTDPFVNLSIEHYLLQKSHAESTILFLYRNRPCVVIGRNQNPWLEVNLGLLRRGVPGLSRGQGVTDIGDDTAAPPESLAPGREQPREAVTLVRRRSGGGTVFHDEGNANWAVICPPAAFDRDRHAEMVVRALTRRLGVAGVRVNGRHDIVQDVGPGEAADADADSERLATFKVSGSAYKLTRLRSLHHGTCLLASPNLMHISPLLRSPAESFILARGVESVRSKVRNLDVDYDDFVVAVKEEFKGMYGGANGGDLAVGRTALEIPEIRKGFEELQSPEWIFGQTPLFTFSTHPTEDDPRQRPELPSSLPPNFRASLSARHGQIQEASLSGLSHRDDIGRRDQEQALSKALIGQTMHHVADWREALEKASPVPIETEPVGDWLNSLLSVESVNGANN